jgi:hypothetical protein
MKNHPFDLIAEVVERLIGSRFRAGDLPQQSHGNEILKALPGGAVGGTSTLRSTVLLNALDHQREDIRPGLPGRRVSREIEVAKGQDVYPVRP